MLDSAPLFVALSKSPSWVYQRYVNRPWRIPPCYNRNGLAAVSRKSKVVLCKMKNEVKHTAHSSYRYKILDENLMVRKWMKYLTTLKKRHQISKRH